MVILYISNKNRIYKKNLIVENKTIKNLKISLNNEERHLKNKSFYSTNTNVNDNTMMMTEENEENQKNNKILDHEQKYNKKLKDIEDNYKKKINEIIRTKDNSLKKVSQDLLKLKSEFEKNVKFYNYRL